MKLATMLFAAATALAGSLAQAAVVFSEGDFSTWTFGSYGVGGGTATAAREATGGNPGARINVTTVTNGLTQTAFGTAFKSDYSTSIALAGTPFTLTLEALSGAGAFGQGQAIQFVVEQNGTLYALPIGVTGVVNPFTPFSLGGNFDANAFQRVTGAGPANPDFSGGVPTRFGFAAGNTNSATLTQYYDNVRLDLAAVPGTSSAPADIPLLSPLGLAALVAALGVLALRRLRRR